MNVIKYLFIFIIMTMLLLVACQPATPIPAPSPSPLPNGCADFSTYPNNTKLSTIGNPLNGYGFTWVGTEPEINTIAGVVGLQFNDAGLEINLPQTVSSITIDVISASRDVNIAALDNNGATVDSDTVSSDRTLHTVALVGKDIVKIVLKGGGYESALPRICS